MTSQVNAEFWKEFITIYKNHPAIWNKNRSDLYTNRQLKKNAYETLLRNLREQFPNATMETLKRKINTLRGCYRRELKKVLNSENIGLNVYVPTLWYFEHLSFLRNQETNTVDKNDRQDNSLGEDDFEWEESKPSVDDKINEEAGTILAIDENTIMTMNDGDTGALEDLIEEDEEQTIAFNPPSSKKARRDSPPAPIAASPTKSRSSSRLVSVQQDCTTIPKHANSDDSSTLSAAWGVLFRRLTPEQQLYANKTIIGVLYQGALGNLDEFSYRILENKHNY